MNKAASVLIVKFRSAHNPEKLMKICDEYLDTFRSIQGLIQKYY